MPEKIHPVTFDAARKVDQLDASTTMYAVLEVHLDDYLGDPGARADAVLGLANLVGKIVEETDSATLEAMVARDLDDAVACVEGLGKLVAEINGQSNDRLLAQPPS